LQDAPAGLYESVALACKQTAALLTQQHQQQSGVEASPVLAKLLSPTTAFHLLGVWCWLMKLAPLRGAVLGSAELLPTVEPACKLAVAAAHSFVSTLLTAAAVGPSSSRGGSSSSSKGRLASRSSSSSGHGGRRNGGHSSTRSLEASAAEVVTNVMAAAEQIRTSVNNERPTYSLPAEEESGGRSRWVTLCCSVSAGSFADDVNTRDIYKARAAGDVLLSNLQTKSHTTAITACVLLSLCSGYACRPMFVTLPWSSHGNKNEQTSLLFGLTMITYCSHRYAERSEPCVRTQIVSHWMKYDNTSAGFAGIMKNCCVCSRL
jgi:hypothetical protein